MSIKEKTLILLSAMLTLGALVSEISFLSSYAGTEMYKLGSGLDFEVGLGVMLFVLTVILLISRPKAFFRMLKIQFAMLSFCFVILAISVHNQDTTLTSSQLQAYNVEE